MPPMATYVEECLARGLDMIRRARLSFFWNSHLDFFEEIAKLRGRRIQGGMLSVGAPQRNRG
jgi:methylmalonyl-CoA mutase N-terminal domain/subunit